MLDEQAAATLRSMVQKGTFGAGVLETADCRATYEELKKKGVEFKSPPEERFYGVEAILRDDSGNWWSMTQPAKR